MDEVVEVFCRRVQIKGGKAGEFELVNDTWGALLDGKHVVVKRGPADKAEWTILPQADVEFDRYPASRKYGSAVEMCQFTRGGHPACRGFMPRGQSKVAAIQTGAWVLVDIGPGGFNPTPA